MSSLLGCALVVTLHFLAASAQKCTRKSSCSCEVVGAKATSRATLANGIIDLSPLDKKNPSTPRFSIGSNFAERNDQFYYNPCSPISGPTGVKNMGCSVKANTAVCQEDFKTLYDCGNQNTMTPFIDKNEIVFFNYTATTAGTKRTTAIQLKCDKSASVENPKLIFVSENPSNNYNFILTSKCCCPGACGPNTGASSTGLSVGSILLIVFFCLLITYFIVGALYMKLGAGASGTEIVPNNTFWFALPSLVKEGVVFLIGKCKRTPDSYEKI